MLRVSLIAAAAIVGVAAAAALSPGVRTRVYSFAIADNGHRQPHEIARGLYYVGSSDVASFLLDTGEGLILINPGYAHTADRLLATIRNLGYRNRDVRLILVTQGRTDHAGALRAVKAATGAEVAAGEAEAGLIEAGGAGDFYLRDWMTYPPVGVDRPLEDGETVRVGRVAITAVSTPGHTPGCTSYAFAWTVDHREGTPALVLCTLSTLHYALVDNSRYPRIAADYAQTFAKLKVEPCALFLADHAKFFEYGRKAKEAEAASGLTDRNPFLDPEGCRAFIADSERSFQSRLERQTAEKEERARKAAEADGR